MMPIPCCLLLAAFFAAPALAQDEVADPPVLIENVRLFDGENIAEHRNVLFADGHIVSVDYRGDVGDEVRRVDGQGNTLLPGLIDAHTHISESGLEDSLLFGVTFAVDLFSRPEETQPAVKRSLSGYNPHEADIMSAGTVATAPGGHGTQFGFEIPTLNRPEDAEAFVAARVAEGSQLLKIIVESRRPTLDGPTIRALVDAAHRHGLLAVAHAQRIKDTRLAVEGGVDGLVHIVSDEALDDELVAAIIRAGIFVVPTYVVHDSQLLHPSSITLLEGVSMRGLVPPSAIANLRMTWNVENREMSDAVIAGNIAVLHAAGVPILAGADAPNAATWYGVSLHRELQLLVESGLSPLQALVAATSAAADAYRISGHGRIANTLPANLVLVEGDPTSDINATTRIIEVWKNGHSVAPLIARRRAQLAATGGSD